MKTGIQLIAQERKEQIKKHGRTRMADKALNKNRQLRDAAVKLLFGRASRMSPPQGWDKKIWNKMKRKKISSRLIIAGALIAAELDRLQAS